MNPLIDAPKCMLLSPSILPFEPPDHLCLGQPSRLTKRLPRVRFANLQTFIYPSLASDHSQRADRLDDYTRG